LVLGAVLPFAASAPASAAAPPVTVTFFPAAFNSFTVPFGVTSLQVTAIGASGGNGGSGGGASGGPGGPGTKITGTLPVTPGQVLGIQVGQGGNGGSGPQGEDCVSQGGQAGINSLIPGGDGGNGGGCETGGGGGGGAPSVITFGNDFSNPFLFAAGGGGGGGASQYFNGGAGGPGGPGTAGGGAGSGDFDNGGARGGQSDTDGGDGQDADACSDCDEGGGGGGGGGLLGGDGGQPGVGGGGGGAGTDLVPSSMINPVVAVSSAGPSANGVVTFTYTPPDATSTVVSCSPDSVVLDQSTTCTATVTDTEKTDPTTPTGTISFASSAGGDFSANQCTLSGSGASAHCSVTYTPSDFGTRGSHTITGDYSGDSTHDDGHGSDAVSVGPRSAKTTVGCSPNPVAVGRTTTCVATVTDTSAGTVSTPTGTVGLQSDGSGSFGGGPCTLSETSPGTASCSVTYTPSALPMNSNAQTIIAQYGGDAKHAGNILSLGFTFLTVISPRSTSTSLSCTPDPVAVGGPTTCTATVSDTDGGTASTPTGTVSFGSSGPGSFSAGQCTLSGSGASAGCSVTYTNDIGSGSQTITGAYGGDAIHADSSGSQAVAVTGPGHPTSTNVSCSPSTVNVEQPSTCTATVTDEVFSVPPTTPTGTVGLFPGGPGSFNGTSPCTLSGIGGSAQCSATFTPSGPEAGGNTTILASYNGDAVHGVSSGTTSVTVNASSNATCADRAASIVGSARADRLAGTRKRDVAVGGPGNDRINAGGGADLVCAGRGNDRVLGGRGNDRVFGQTGDDTLFGGPGRDVLNGGPGNDRVSGGPGNDRIDPGTGRDHVSAGAGEDRIVSVDRRRDVIDCGPGRDEAIVDAVDRVRHCQIVVRVPTLLERQQPSPRAGLG
jgi:hemolysin type calcium-binding protein/Big-like domain-containing protein